MNELVNAVKENETEKVRQMLHRHVVQSPQDLNWINLPDGQGLTALSWAIKKNDLNLVDLLLEHKANPDLGITLGQVFLDRSCLELALDEDNENIIRKLLLFSANPYLGKPSTNEYLLGHLNVPLHIAAKQSTYPINLLLLNATPLVAAHESDVLKLKWNQNSKLTAEQKEALNHRINQIMKFLNEPQQAVQESPHEFIHFIKQNYSNTFHYNNILNCLAEALKTTSDRELKDQLCSLIGKVGEYYHEKYLDSSTMDTTSLTRAYGLWSKVSTEDLKFYLALMKKSFRKIGADHFDILLEHLKIPHDIAIHEHKNQFLILYGKIFHEKYLNSGNVDTKSLASACLKWSEIANPAKLATDENLLLGELMHVAKQDGILSLCYSLMDCYQREIGILLHLGAAAAIFDVPIADKSVSDDVILARRLLAELVEPTTPFSAESDFDNDAFRVAYDKKLHDLLEANKQLKRIGWDTLNKSMRLFLSFLIKNDKFDVHHPEYELFRNLASHKLDAEIATEASDRQKHLEEMRTLLATNSHAITGQDKATPFGFLKRFFSNSLTKKYLSMLTEIDKHLQSIQANLNAFSHKQR